MTRKRRQAKEANILVQSILEEQDGVQLASMERSVIPLFPKVKHCDTRFVTGWVTISKKFHFIFLRESS